MKKQVLAGAQPWKDAFDRLKASTDLTAVIKPFAHIKRGPSGRPNIGGLELERDVNMAYDCAILWYITDNQSYADKAIEIFNTWSTGLWDFDYNDAKLLAAWKGQNNAVELLLKKG
ncbi:MAG: alginate lyase family protein, partial [Desulfobacterales bacterium]|nr:alginate lyase family protein [Desulfobacterales bacterium]